MARIATEHRVDPGGLGIYGHPRWWTLTDSRGRTVEAVRAEVPIRPGMDPETRDRIGVQTDRGLVVVWWFLLPTGAYQWPPFVSATVRLGDAGIDSVEQRGGRAFVLPMDEALALERSLVDRVGR